MRWNCLFYSLSYITFGTEAYFNEIRAFICDYMEEYKNILNKIRKEEEKIDYIKI